ncbi:MAG: protoporphyrinogen oxidase [Bacillaceae bacterium]|nr:protoporphyrinogen oxidase [Bacillaceae bacterium]
MELKQVVVVGGGITGLSTAFYLKKKAAENGENIKIHVVEKADRFGGKIRTFRRDGFILEEGPDSFLARKEAALQLCRDLGLEVQLTGTNPDARKNYILRKNKLHLMPPGTMLGVPAEITPFARTRLLSPAGKLRAAMDLVLPRGNDEHDESLGLFLRRRFGDELVDHLIEPLLSGIYAGNADLLSLQATFPLFHDLEKKHRSLILGIMKQRKQQRIRQKQIAPDGKSSKHPSMFLALNSGFDTLIKRLTEQLERDGISLISEALVTQVEKLQENGRPHYQIKLTNHNAIRADAVVMAAPAFATQKLLSKLIATEPLSQIPYVSVATVGLAFNKDQIQHPLDGSGFVVPHKENRFITACTWVSSKWPHTTPEGKLLLRCFTGHSGDERHKDLSDEEIVTRVLKDLADIMGISSEPEWTHVSRWNQAMPQYLVDHLSRLGEFESRIKDQLPGIMLTGAGYYGVGVPDCIAQGMQTAEKVLSYLSDEG